MSAPRVLISGIVLSQPMGGVRRHNAELMPRVARLLAAEGGSLTVLEGRIPVAFDLPSVVERLPSKVPPRPVFLRAALESRALKREIRRAAKSGRPFDLVHTAHLPAPRGLPLPFTLTIHDLRSLDLPESTGSRRPFARRFVTDALRRARIVFTVSETIRSRILSQWALPDDRVRVLPNAADHLRPLPRAEKNNCLLHVGHLEPRKNLGLLLEAIALDPNLPPLVLAGRAKGDEEIRLRRRARELRIEDRVHFHGPFDDAELPKLYAEAACVALPSRVEGFGIVAVEAMAARVPLAVSSAGALPEVAGPDVPTFPPDDAGACADAIRSALETSREVLGQHAERALRFRWDDSARAWVDGWKAAVRTRDSSAIPFEPPVP